MPATRRAVRKVDTSLAKHTETTSTTDDGTSSDDSSCECVCWLEAHIVELYNLLDTSGLTLKASPSIRDRMDKRTNAAEALAGVLQRAADLAGHEAQDRNEAYSFAAESLLQEIVRLRELPGGALLSLSTILKLAEIAWQDVTEVHSLDDTLFTLHHTFWINADHHAYGILLNLPADDWDVWDSRLRLQIGRRYLAFRKETVAVLSGRGVTDNPIFSWSCAFLKIKGQHLHAFKDR